MQPYLIPYAGYFGLIAHTQSWVVFDLAQYTPKTWMNRNRLANPAKGWAWVSASLAKSAQQTAIAQMRLVSLQQWRSTLVGAMAHYRGQTRRHDRVAEVVLSATAGLPEQCTLVQLNVATMSSICHYLDIAWTPIIASQEISRLPPARHPGDWAPTICATVGADAYLNPEGGAGLFCGRQFSEAGVQLQFYRHRPLAYDTGRLRYQPNLSIVDAMMWMDPGPLRQAIVEAGEVLAPAACPSADCNGAHACARARA